MAVLLLQLEGVQNFLRIEGQKYLQRKLNTKVHIGYLRARGWKYLELRDIYIADTSNQTLFYTANLKLRYNLLALISNELRIERLDWDTLIVNAYKREHDTVFNYQFAIDAFSSPNSKPDTLAPSSGTTIQFRLKDLNFKTVKLQFWDVPGGMHAAATFDSLHLDPDDILIDDGIYAFRNITLDGLKGFFRQKYIPAATTKAAPPPPKIDTTSASLHLLLRKLLVQNSYFLYEDEGAGISTNWKVGKLQVTNSSLDQDSTYIQIGDLALSQAAGFVMMVPGKSPAPATPAESTPNTWKVFANQVNMDRIVVRYDNGGPAPKAAGPDPDYNHLLLHNLDGKIQNIRYQPDSISAVVKALSAKDKSGFTLRKTNMEVIYTPQVISLNKLLIQTNRSIIRKSITITAPSWSMIADKPDLLGIDANLDSVRIALGEWLGFVPGARKNSSFKPLWNKDITLSALLKGTMANLNIRQLYINDHEGNIIRANNSQVTQATDPDNFSAYLPDLYIESGNKALRSWLPPGTLPDTPRLPNHMVITGMLKGGLKNMITALQLKSDYVNANINARLTNITDSIRSSYALNIPYFRANPGIMLYDTTYGWVSGRLEANGQGYTISRMIANANAQLSEATYNKYTYHGVSINGSIDKGDFHAQGESADTNVLAQFNVKGVLSDTTVRDLHLFLDLTNADLYATNWYSEPLTLKGNLNADFASIEPQRVEGSAYLTNWQIATNGQVFPIDSTSLLAEYTDQQYISLKSPVGTINANGHMDYRKIGAAYSGIISKPLLPYDSANIIQIPGNQVVSWTASLIWPKSLQPLFPALRMDVPLTMEGRINSDSSLLYLHAAATKLEYDSLQIDSLRIYAKIVDTTLNSYTAISKLNHPTFPLFYTYVAAKANAGQVEFNTLLTDVNRQPKYKFGGYLSFLNDNVIELSLKPGILLNKEAWSVDNNNVFRLHNGMPDTANIRLYQGAQSIHLYTQHDSSTVPVIAAKITDFHLSTITGLLATDTLLANGILNADATVRNWNASPLILANLKVDDLTVRNKPFGTLDAKVSNLTPTSYALTANLSGSLNDIKLDGTYDSTINANLNINKLSMSSLEPFTMGSVSRMAGTANGQFTITGTPSDPKVDGSLHFNNASGMVNMIGSTFHLPDENILIDEKGIKLNNLVVADSLNNELIVNGRINTNDYSRFFLNLDVNANNFMVLGKQQTQDQWIYGPAFVDSKIKIRGTSDLPRVDAVVTLKDKSKVTMTLPQDEPGLATREGVVEFVDMSNPVDSALLARQDSLKYSTTRLQGIYLSGNLDITPESIIKIIIDAQNGDYVQAQGTASINATLDPSSKLSLTGRYEINEGKYEMSLNQLIKRSFDIQKGSSITFNGDPTNADVDITAKYTVNASAYDLVADQLSSMTAEQRNTYRQRMPFLVYLMIKGSILKPDISFQLDMEEKDRNSLSGTPYNRIKQINQVPSELNKQVMGLLVLNTFIPDDPTNTLESTGGGVEQAARNSVSKILSQQLNNLAGNLIKGIDLNFDLKSQEDYSTGSAQETTTLNVGASKKLFNDRLSVSVGSNIMLTGNTQNASNLIGDISIEYKLTSDGRYRIRVYQRNDGTTVIDGQVVETGVAFALVMDYDEFREIFQRSKIATRREKLRNNKNNDDKNPATTDAIIK
ncbi:translocation/assembly module TamB [Chitinophaga silvatica]|uniref:Translocation/assembly module TamB n=2 Tax=Chitinophaga silvatica TaxID=2282649 RepID=A0A3E1YBE2_9BACT|nr:translocation/assembly module TamB [Chitinophaga silvatica]